MRHFASTSTAGVLRRGSFALRRWSAQPAAVVSMLIWSVLAVFHAWVFAQRLADGSLLQTEVILRWLASLVIAGAFWAIARRGASVMRGRRATALWLLVVLVHAGIAVPVTPVGEALTELPLGALGFVALPAVLSLDLLTALALTLLVLAAGRIAAETTSISRLVAPPRRLLAVDYPPAFRRPPPVR